MLTEQIDTIQNIDCMVGLKDLQNECIDLIISDIPYLLVGGGCSEGEYKTKNGHGQVKGVLNKQREYVPVEGNDHGHTLLAGTKHVNLGGKLNDQANAVRAGKMFEHNNIKFSEYLPELYRVLKKGTHCYLMINARNLKELWEEAEKAGFVFQNLLAWDKGGGTPNKYYMQCMEFILMLSKRPARNINDMGCKTLLKTPNIIGKTEHPTQKPIGLMRLLIEQSSNPGDVVLDPFMGSGTTAIAALLCERHFCGYEIDKQYWDVCQKRLYHTPIQQTLF